MGFKGYMAFSQGTNGFQLSDGSLHLSGFLSYYGFSHAMDGFQLSNGLMILFG